MPGIRRFARSFGRTRNVMGGYGAGFVAALMVVSKSRCCPEPMLLCGDVGGDVGGDTSCLGNHDAEMRSAVREAVNSLLGELQSGVRSQVCNSIEKRTQG